MTTDLYILVKISKKSIAFKSRNCSNMFCHILNRVLAFRQVRTHFVLWKCFKILYRYVP
jgi:hypothetical protein